MLEIPGQWIILLYSQIHSNFFKERCNRQGRTQGWDFASLVLVHIAPLPANFRSPLKIKYPSLATKLYMM